MKLYSLQTYWPLFLLYVVSISCSTTNNQEIGLPESISPRYDDGEIIEVTGMMRHFVFENYRYPISKQELNKDLLRKQLFYFSNGFDKRAWNTNMHLRKLLKSRRTKLVSSENQCSLIYSDSRGRYLTTINGNPCIWLRNDSLLRASTYYYTPAFFDRNGNVLFKYLEYEPGEFQTGLQHIYSQYSTRILLAASDSTLLDNAPFIILKYTNGNLYLYCKECLSDYLLFLQHRDESLPLESISPYEAQALCASFISDLESFLNSYRKTHQDIHDIIFRTQIMCTDIQK